MVDVMAESLESLELLQLSELSEIQKPEVALARRRVCEMVIIEVGCTSPQSVPCASTLVASYFRMCLAKTELSLSEVRL